MELATYYKRQQSVLLCAVTAVSFLVVMAVREMFNYLGMEGTMLCQFVNNVTFRKHAMEPGCVREMLHCCPDLFVPTIPC